MADSPTAPSAIRDCQLARGVRRRAHTDPWRIEMTLCPIAIAIGCKKCPVFKICLVKGIIGDYRKPADVQPPAGKPKSARKHGK